MNANPAENELGRLTTLLCDGEITPAEAAQLEQLVLASPAARRWFTRYTQLHAELYWEHASKSIISEPPALPRTSVRRSWRRLVAGHPGSLTLAAAAVAALVLVAVHWAGSSGHFVARLSDVQNVQWNDGSAGSRQGQRLSVGQLLQLRSGLATVTYDDGVQLRLQGPAALEIAAVGAARLEHGAVVAKVPHAAAGFVLLTPPARIVDRGTEFGVRSSERSSVELQVFAGRVDVQDEQLSDHRCLQEVRGGEAVRVVRCADATLSIASIAFDPHAFAHTEERTARSGPSVAALRAIVAADPNLAHHYTFEGRDAAEKCRDRRGELDLNETVMGSGRGSGAVQYAVAAFDRAGNAVAPWRGGNSLGVAWQSGAVFHPPEEMTVELLLTYGPRVESRAGGIAAAVATRSNARQCSFFVAAIDDGQLVHLFDADAPWTEGDLEFVPGDWYYVASTFCVHNGTTTVNSYVADLTRGETTLARVVKDQRAPGVPQPGFLGVGKGFSNDLTHAYPWSGALDEIAIYRAVLPKKTLLQHLHALVGGAEEVTASTAAEE